MGEVSLDERIGTIRAVIFPFFDPIEIAFTFGVLALEVFVLLFVQISNAWVIPIGSYLGMTAVAWTALPSRVSFNRNELERIRSKAKDLGFREIAPSQFVPPLPRMLRWPRNRLRFEIHDEIIVYGPRVLLTPLLRKGPRE